MALIGEGSYGCIYKPALKCENSFSVEGTNTVSKLFENSDEYESQARINQTLKNIDPKNFFTVPVYGKCTVNGKNIRYKCGHISDENKKYKQIIYGYGGVSLMDYMKKKPGSLRELKRIFLMMGPLLDGISKLVDKELIHGDIKPDNIVIRGKRAYLIDFGLMMSGRELFSVNRATILNYNYPYFSPDYKLFLAKNFREFRNKFLKNFDFSFHFANSTVDIQHIWEDLGIDMAGGLHAIWKSRKRGVNYGSQDIWSLGIVWYLLWAWSGKSSDFISDQIGILIGKIINFTDRIDIKQLIEEYGRICKMIRRK